MLDHVHVHVQWPWCMIKWCLPCVILRCPGTTSTPTSCQLLGAPQVRTHMHHTCTHMHHTHLISLSHTSHTSCQLLGGPQVRTQQRHSPGSQTELGMSALHGYRRQCFSAQPLGAPQARARSCYTSIRMMHARSTMLHQCMKNHTVHVAHRSHMAACSGAGLEPLLFSLAPPLSHTHTHTNTHTHTHMQGMHDFIIGCAKKYDVDMVVHVHTHMHYPCTVSFSFFHV